jgi:hypothetical protein
LVKLFPTLADEEDLSVSLIVNMDESFFAVSLGRIYPKADDFRRASSCFFSFRAFWICDGVICEILHDFDTVNAHRLKRFIILGGGHIFRRIQHFKTEMYSWTLMVHGYL